MGKKTFRANWIAPGSTDTLPVIKKDFLLNQKIKSADIFISGLGLFDLYINGVKAHDTFFEPGESVYEKTVFYSHFDVSSYLKEGENEIKVYLGNGFYYNETRPGDRLNRTPKILGERMLLCQLEIMYETEEALTICSDETWHYGTCPITESIWLGGETFDQRKKETMLSNVRVVTHFPFGSLKERPFPPIKITETIRPVSCTKLSNGNYLIDFGMNFAGTYQFCASAPKDTHVNLYFGEILNEDGSVNQRDFWGKIYDTVIFGEQEKIEYTPRFVYHGFRYIEVTGMKVSADNFIGFQLRCNNPKVLQLWTDNPKINKIHRLICRSIEDNMQSVLTDCPHREKLGWTEVYHLLFETISYNYDTKDYYKKLLLDLADAQSENGGIPSIVPSFTKGIKEHALREGPDETPNDPAWCGALIFAGYKYHLFYDDKKFLKKLYPSMKQYLTYLNSLSEEHLLPAKNLNRDLGDWMAIEPATVSFAVSCTYYRLYDIMDKIAAILGQEESYKAEKELIRNAINRTYFKDGIYDNGSQSATVLALSCGITCESDKETLMEYLHSSIVKNDYKLTVGEVALKPLFDLLCKYGHADAAYRILLNAYGTFADTHTTLPESWDGRFSQNHAMLGAGDSFFLEHLAGIQVLDPGFKEISLSPYFPSDINRFHLVFDSPNGKIEVNWKRENGKVDFHCIHDEQITLHSSHNL